MRKITRLTESDLTRIVKKVIREQGEQQDASKIAAEVMACKNNAPTVNELLKKGSLSSMLILTLSMGDSFDTLEPIIEFISPEFADKIDVLRNEIKMLKECLNRSSRKIENMPQKDVMDWRRNRKF